MSVFSPNLNIEHLEGNSDQPEVPVDTAIDAFDAAITALVAYAVTNTNALALTQAQMAAQNTIQLINGGTSPTALVTVTVAAFARGDFTVDNTLAWAADVKIAAQAGTVPRVPAGKKRRLHSDGVNVTDLGDAPYTVATLPANPVNQQREWVSDGLAPVFAAAVAGGGAVLTPVYWDNGAATWRCG